METVNEALGLLQRQAELEQSMKQSGGIRITRSKSPSSQTPLGELSAGHAGGRAGRSRVASARHGSDRRGCRILGANESRLKSCRSKTFTRWSLAWAPLAFS